MAKRDPKNVTVQVSEGVYRRNGRYFVRVADPITGKRPQQYPPEFDLPNTADGARQLKRLLEDRKARTRGGAGEAVEEFAARWMRDYGGERGESTRIHNAERVQAFARDFRGRRMGEVTHREARAWTVGGAVPDEIAKVAAGWSGSKVRADGTVEVASHRGNHAAVRAMYNDALRDRLVAENPFANLRVAQSRGRKGIFVLTEEELGRLVGFAHKVHGPYGQMFGALIAVAAWTGVRPGELFALRWGDVDFDRGELRVREQFNSKTGRYGPTKNSFPRTVVLTPGAGEALRGLPRHVADDLVFHTKQGKPYTGRTHHYAWNPVRKAFVASLPETHHLRQRLAASADDDFDFYELRHFCATYLLELGLAPADVALQLGHRDGGALVMSTYGHPSEDAARERIRQAFAKAV